MSFTPFQSIRDQFDDSTCKKIDEIEKRFGSVELKHISKLQVCLRIHAKIKGEITPIAAIGRSVDNAIERLLRVSKTVIESD